MSKHIHVDPDTLEAYGRHATVLARDAVMLRCEPDWIGNLLQEAIPSSATAGIAATACDRVEQTLASLETDIQKLGPAFHATAVAYGETEETNTRHIRRAGSSD